MDTRIVADLVCSGPRMGAVSCGRRGGGKACGGWAAGADACGVTAGSARRTPSGTEGNAGRRSRPTAAAWGTGSGDVSARYERPTAAPARLPGGPWRAARFRSLRGWRPRRVRVRSRRDPNGLARRWIGRRRSVRVRIDLCRGLVSSGRGLRRRRKPLRARRDELGLELGRRIRLELGRQHRPQRWRLSTGLRKERSR